MNPLILAQELLMDAELQGKMIFLFFLPVI